MYKLSVTETFSAAHRLCGYQGACQNLHGHNWKVRIGLICDTLDEIGMAMDFGIIKKYLNTILNDLDHQYLNEIPPFDQINPTSEHLAKYVYERMQSQLGSDTCRVYEVEICESERSSVVYAI